MILTCPRCAARYAVDRDKIPASGRPVRCVSCRNKWTALPEDGEAEPWEAPRPEPPRKPRAKVEAPPPPPPEPVMPDPEPPPPEEAFPNVDPVIPAPRPAPRRRVGPPAPLVWAGLAAILAVIALMLALFRNEVVRIWPKTAALYAAAGMSVNGVGLVIEAVRLTPAVQNGQAVLGVAGKIRNERDHPTPSAPLQVTLYNSAGAEVARVVARPVDVVPPLETRYFSVKVLNPPPGVASASLAFVSHAPGSGKGEPAPGPHAATPPVTVHATHAVAAPAEPYSPPAAPNHEGAAHAAGAPAPGHD